VGDAKPGQVRAKRWHVRQFRLAECGQADPKRRVGAPQHAGSALLGIEHAGQTVDRG
jgi:hypothetical protein